LEKKEKPRGKKGGPDRGEMGNDPHSAKILSWGGQSRFNRIRGKRVMVGLLRKKGKASKDQRWERGILRRA